MVKKTLCSLLITVATIISSTVPAFALQAPAKQILAEKNNHSNSVEAIYTDENGINIPVEVTSNLTEISTFSDGSGGICILTASASSPKKGSKDDGIVWANMSVYYEWKYAAQGSTAKTYRMLNASGDWSFGNYPGASTSSTSVTFSHGDGSSTIKLYGMSFNEKNPNTYWVARNSCTSKISYRTSSSMPPSTLSLTVKVN